jgi:hypothetical protein
MSVIQKATSGGLLTKPSMRKKLLITKNMYILKLLHNIVTAELRHLYQGVSFCMLVSKKSAACELSHILTSAINSLG